MNLQPIPTHTQVLVCLSSINGVKVEYNQRIYNTVPFAKPKKATHNAPKERRSTAHTPLDTHYYKYGQDLFKRITFDESDQEVLEMLQEVFLGKYKKLA